MDFGRLLADPIMEHTIVNSLFFSSQRYGRFFFPQRYGRFRFVSWKTCFQRNLQREYRYGGIGRGSRLGGPKFEISVVVGFFDVGMFIGTNDVTF